MVSELSCRMSDVPLKIRYLTILEYNTPFYKKNLEKKFSYKFPFKIWPAVQSNYLQLKIYVLAVHLGKNEKYIFNIVFKHLQSFRV